MEEHMTRIFQWILLTLAKRKSNSITTMMRWYKRAVKNWKCIFMTKFKKITTSFLMALERLMQAVVSAVGIRSLIETGNSQKRLILTPIFLTRKHLLIIGLSTCIILPRQTIISKRQPTTESTASKRMRLWQKSTMRTRQNPNRSLEMENPQV